jgi:hypothetical protein
MALDVSKRVGSLRSTCNVGPSIRIRSSTIARERAVAILERLSPDGAPVIQSDDTDPTLCVT